MAKKKDKKEKVTLNAEELQRIVNLLFSGKFGFSAQESRQVVTPLINKLSKLIDQRTE